MARKLLEQRRLSSIVMSMKIGAPAAPGFEASTIAAHYRALAWRATKMAPVALRYARMVRSMLGSPQLISGSAAAAARYGWFNGKSSTVLTLL